jgi:putative endonuclease
MEAFPKEEGSSSTTLRRSCSNSAETAEMLRARRTVGGMKTQSNPAVRARSALAIRGETLACEHLERAGYRIVERNARTRFGEIDVIAHGHDAIVFVEVKTRRAGGSAGEPLEAIDHRKVRQVRKLAASWLAEAPNRPSATDIRFDAIGVTIDRAGGLVALDHLEAAF